VREGHPIAVPTESSYGLSVHPGSEEGVRRIYQIKSRERGKPLPVVVSDVTQLEALGGRLDPPALARLARRWPAALSLLVPIKRPLPAAAGTGRLAVRIPDHARLRGLLSELGTGLTATSANRSGEPPLTDPDDVRELLRSVAGSIVIDGGVLPGGEPSTLVSVEGGEIELLRPGRIG
jgi:L-threonylcarbamoyladenylate synthase